ncbi:MAG: GDSL family lipase [Actinobacteria bacterium 13_2_20CM_2_71_6]|nr:MAG: GDSL family lipase [Actinobacteria bacterium 13_2_20CM_2_71_6]
MSRASRVAAAAAYGGGGVGVAGVLAAILLLGQARLARRTIPLAEAPPPRCDGRYGTEYDGVPLRLAMLGDSSAAGYGVDRPRDTPGALLAAGLAERLHWPVEVRSVAVVGSTSAGLVPQRELALAWRPDVAVILVGANDVTHRIRVPLAVGHLAQTVRLLHAEGAEVVVGTCPDLGTIRPIQPPLRWLARQWSRDMAAAQTIGVVEAGGATVSLGDLLGPEFAASPETMFAWDRFHPSATGYLAATAAMLPTVVAAAGGAADARPVPARGEGVRSLAQAAVEAVDQAGTEVSGAEVAGQERGPAGRWADLRHRLRTRIERPQDPVNPAGVRVE